MVCRLPPIVISTAQPPAVSTRFTSQTGARPARWGTGTIATPRAARCSVVPASTCQIFGYSRVGARLKPSVCANVSGTGEKQERFLHGSGGCAEAIR